MKTQLLEDIGQSTTLHLVPSGGVSNSRSHKGGQDLGQARAATPIRPRSAAGVWRQKPADEPVVLATHQLDQQPLPDAPTLSELIAAVEAQLMLSQPVHEAAIPPAEPTPAVSATQSEPAPQDPVPDFIPPSSTPPAPDLFRREPSWFERSGRRYLMWGSCVLAGALVIQAGLWFYDERKEASALALVADELKADPQVDKVRTAPTEPASLPGPVPRTAPTVAPLVLLQPEPKAGTKVEPTAALAADRKELQAPPKPEQSAEQTPAAPLPKGDGQTEREQLVAAATPEQARVERAPDRQLARPPLAQAERKTDTASPMAATLKACREHGYDAAQCVKRACSVTKYGFFCRGKN